MIPGVFDDFGPGRELEDDGSSFTRSNLAIANRFHKLIVN